MVLPAVVLTVVVAGVLAVLLAVVSVSYRQVCRAYPSGGGAYIVSKDNLGILPGLIAAAIFTFILAWNDFLFALSLTSTSDTRTVPAAMSYFTGDTTFQKPTAAIAAAAVIITIPKTSAGLTPTRFTACAARPDSIAPPPAPSGNASP